MVDLNYKVKKIKEQFEIGEKYNGNKYYALLDLLELDKKIYNDNLEKPEGYADLVVMANEFIRELQVTWCQSSYYLTRNKMVKLNKAIQERNKKLREVTPAQSL